ncbi:MAG: GNAT family N-acetyltransferase [Acidimicrobiales bacterium]
MADGRRRGHGPLSGAAGPHRDVTRPPPGTDRLVLRRWTAADRVPFAAINADPVVMEHFPAPLSTPESDALVERIEHDFDHFGYGLWAVEVPGLTSFAGYVGLADATFDAPFTPAIEIGWRLGRPWWGRGIATEAARAVLQLAFTDLRRREVVSFTAATNLRSQAVMARLGMHRDPTDDFDHPRVPADSSVRRHVLYRLGAEEWLGPSA